MRRSLLSVVVVATLTASASAQGWGTIKGQFVIEGGKPPPVVVLDVNKDQPHCLSRGPIFSEKYVVGKNGGVRWVVAWIATEQDGKANHKVVPPIHPQLLAIKDKQVVLDQPCCKFEPRVVVMRKGQDFVWKNSAPIAHALNLVGMNGVNLNVLLLPGGINAVPAARWNPHYFPSSVSCNIHSWMKSWLFVLDHPYFAISDEEGKFEIKNVPAGKLRLLMWHEGMGWVHKREEGKKGFDGQGITVEAGKALDIGKVPVKLE